MITASFDLAAFARAIDRVREERGLSWYEVWRKTTIDHATLRKLRDGRAKSMSVHTLATLAAWSGLDVAQFIRSEESRS